MCDMLKHHKKKTFRVISCIFMAILTQYSVAQETLYDTGSQDSLIGSIDVNIMDYLPPLAVLIDSAMNHAPEKDYYDALVEVAERDVILAQKDWAKDVRVTGGYTWTYGNQVLSQYNVVLNNNQINEGYNLGVGITIPLSTWYGRKDRIEKAEAMRESQLARYSRLENEVKESVIETYNQLILLRKQLDIISEAKESSRLISDMAEDLFRDGEMTLDQLGQTTELKARYASEYEQLRTEFNNTYLRLERIVGVPFSKFKTIRQKEQ